MLNQIVAGAPVFLLLAARIFALLMSVPLFSTRSTPRRSKLALSGFMAFMVLPQISLASGTFSDYAQFISATGEFNLNYVFLVAGEVLIGLLIGLYINIIFAVFSSAGQFFSFQLGFSAAEVYDVLSQVENPIMGQLFNLVAMLVFLQNKWFLLLFTKGLSASFQTISAMSIVQNSDHVIKFLFKGLSILFYDATIISLPILGTLFVLTVGIGLLSKAAPQMNLLSEGFPIYLLTTYLILTVLIPVIINFFGPVFTQGFKEIEHLFTAAKFTGSGGV